MAPLQAYNGPIPNEDAALIQVGGRRAADHRPRTMNRLAEFMMVHSLGIARCRRGPAGRRDGGTRTFPSARMGP